MHLGHFTELLTRLESLRPRAREAVELMARSVCDASEYLAQAWVLQFDDVLREGNPEDAEEVKEFLDATLGLTEQQGDDRISGMVKFWQEALSPFLPRGPGEFLDPNRAIPGDRI